VLCLAARSIKMKAKEQMNNPDKPLLPVLPRKLLANDVQSGCSLLSTTQMMIAACLSEQGCPLRSDGFCQV